MPEPDDDNCACGKGILEVTLAHYLSCGDDAPMEQGEAEDFQGRLVERLERTLGPITDDLLPGARPTEGRPS